MTDIPGPPGPITADPFNIVLTEVETGSPGKTADAVKTSGTRFESTTVRLVGTVGSLKSSMIWTKLIRPPVAVEFCSSNFASARRSVVGRTVRLYPKEEVKF
ncbi:unknown protein [Microcystis aeruginosa NIES-843]|uniref:Uncharacterized protein n=1 Tax=Microcystis aeruginosa (strain NIES-843 / IAM M-2473) TaxID=449447 RepID=B0JLG9_MICAN|nr:unknown protein [Microcystis aeruginosa NIES-843]